MEKGRTWKSTAPLGHDHDEKTSLRDFVRRLNDFFTYHRFIDDDENIRSLLWKDQPVTSDKRTVGEADQKNKTINTSNLYSLVQILSLYAY